jgi:hypothetical protein
MIKAGLRRGAILAPRPRTGRCRGRKKNGRLCNAKLPTNLFRPDYLRDTDVCKRCAAANLLSSISPRERARWLRDWARRLFDAERSAR